MNAKLPLIMLAASLAACAGVEPQTQFIPSGKSAVELRAAQTRVVQGEPDAVMRGVIATLHDLGYRITRADPGTGTVSATRQTQLRMAVVVQPRSSQESVVRANAVVLAPLREAQVDSAEFYERNFYSHLGATLQRQLAAAPEDAAAPEPARPAAEFNTARAREAAARSAANAGATSATGPVTR
jgi:hypothetical protein